MLKSSLSCLLLILTWILCLSNVAHGIECYSCEGGDCLKENYLKNTIKCNSRWDDCVSIFNKMQILARGCYSDIPLQYQQICDKSEPTTCHMCYGNLCNDRNPVSCIQCNSVENWNCFYDPANIDPTPCDISISASNGCYVRYNASGYMERGCLRAKDEQECHNRRYCKSCQPINGFACNNEYQPMTMGAAHMEIYAPLMLAATAAITMMLR